MLSAKSNDDGSFLNIFYKCSGVKTRIRFSLDLKEPVEPKKAKENYFQILAGT